jgi:peptide/nickel transport system substrate-binding protein
MRLVGSARRFAWMIALSVLCLGGCTRTETSRPAGNGRHGWTVPDTLRIGTASVPRTLNPLLSTQPFEAALDRLFSDVLVTVDAHGNFVPDLAAEVPTTSNGGISADGLSIRYKLRDHVKWQDGYPFTSNDVKFTYEAIMNPANDIVSRHGYDDVGRVETPDAHTVVFHLKHRFAPFVATVFGESDGPFCILPAHLLAARKTLNDAPYNSLPIGTGPFRVVRWLRGNELELTRNDDYFLGRPKLSAIIVKFSPDENSELVGLRTHDLDWFYDVSVNAYKLVRQIPADDVRIVLTSFNGYEAIIFNTAKGPTKDRRIRRAITYALDKPGLVRRLTFGAAEAATEDLPPFLWAYDASLHATPFDRAQSARLLAAAGYGPAHRLTLDLYFEQSAAINKTLSVQIQSLLEPLGIDLRLHAQLSSVIYGSYAQNGTLERGRYDLALNTWTSGVDPDDSSQFTCSNITPSGVNPSYLCDPAMDAAQVIALETYGRPARKAAYARVQELLERDVPQDFLWWPKQIEAINPDLHGFDPNPVVETWNAWTWSI